MDFKEFIPTYKASNVKEEFEYRFTIFTPVYNREDTLHRVFSSLNNQTFRNFELVLINDGSTDRSHEVALELLKNATFDVNYINNIDNQHKMACYFQAISLAKGEFLVILDSDDECVENALFLFDEAYISIPSEKKKLISGVTALCMDASGNIIGDKFPEDQFYSNSFKQELYYPNEKERWGFTKTEILRNITINPNMFSRGLIPEGLIWMFIANQGFNTLYVNKIVRVYYTNTHNRLSIKDHEKNSFGQAVYSFSVLNWFSRNYFWKQPKIFLRRIYTLLRAAHYLPYKKHDYIRALPNRKLKIIFIVGWPFKHLLR
ncbi:glycosyltransferase family 2 protein [Gelidibacter gilvus]|uniref:Glycosyltransferase family 2 protein n=1 Tax=Gelidibacter gilvus TaxID=59602 RepID=A0A4Q0XDY9_9FLAO|nr:glycosyltransferase family 2 protein [Gelidibacter gilvus]RXJ45967.1 glycosyltransferase family 2 protein [Gelidibacter gilvus]